jgi:hypothetical protein
MFINLHREILCRQEGLKQMILRGQTEIVSAMILIGAVIVVGIAFTALTVSQVSNVIAQGQVQQLLISEQANLFLYKEYEDSNKLCIGVLRISPSSTRYVIALVSGDGTQDLLAENQEALSIPTSTAPLSPISWNARSVYYVYQGQYYPLPMKGYITVVRVPDDIIQNYVMQQKPFLICVDKTKLSSSSAKLLILIQVGDSLYEVGEWGVQV